MDIIKKYWENVYIFLILYTPIACICAGIYYTICWKHGVYSDLPTVYVVIFDISHYIYLLISLWLIYQKVHKKKPVLELLPLMKIHMTLSLSIQFNLIVHLFPSRYVWACIFIFLMPIAFFFDFKMMVLNSSIYTISLIIGHIIHHKEFMPTTTTYYKLELLFQITIVIIAIVFQLILTYFLELFLKRTQIEEEENLFLAKQQLEYYEHLNIMDNELRRFRHDIKNHFLCLQTLLEKERLSEATQYFADLEHSFQSKPNVYLSGNVIIDSILNYQLSRLNEISVTPIVYGKLPEITAISQMDLCTVFSNMLSNAVAATKNCHDKEPMLIIHFEHGEHFFSISVVNTSNQTSTDEPHTKRFLPDRNHGHGIHQIRSIIEKYDGIFEQNIENGLFQSRIYLPVQNK